MQTDVEFYRSALEFIRDVRIECTENVNREAWLRELAREALDGIDPKTGKPRAAPNTRENHG